MFLKKISFKYKFDLSTSASKVPGKITTVAIKLSRIYKK